MLLAKVKTPRCSGKLEVQVSLKQQLMPGEMHTMEQRGIFLPFRTLLFVGKRLKATSRQEIREGDALDK